MSLTPDDMFLSLIAIVRQYGKEGNLIIEHPKATYQYIMDNGGKARLVMIPFFGEDKVNLALVVGEENINEWQAMGLLSPNKVGQA